MTDRETWPRVTDILKSAGLIDTTWFTDEARARGTAVHLACQYLDEGCLDEATVAEEIRPYLAAYQRFRAEVITGEWTAIEQPVYHETLRYRGTPDRVFGSWLYDIKTGGPLAWHGPQLAAYAACLPEITRRIGLYLSVDGGYNLVEYKDRDDWKVFQAALTVHNFKEAR